jgi:hypothetical protein
MEDINYNPNYPSHNNGNLSRSELVQKVQQGANWVNNSGGERAYFAYEDFSNKTFGGLDFSHATMAFTNCQGATFSGCDFTETNFRGANLAGADLSGCELSYANFAGSILTNVNLTGARLHNTFGNGKEIKNFYISKFLTTYTTEYVSIGCIYKPLDWLKTCTIDDILKIYPEEDAAHMLEQIKAGAAIIDLAPCIPVIDNG